MNVLTSLSNGLSLVTGLSTRSKVEIVMGALIAAGLVAAWLWLSNLQDTNIRQAGQIATQGTDIAGLKKDKEQLAIAKAAAEAERDAYAKRTETLNQENKDNEQKAQQYLADSETMRIQLRRLQGKDTCAGHAVPDGVVSVQQQAISAFNAKYSG